MKRAPALSAILSATCFAALTIIGSAAVASTPKPSTSGSLASQSLANDSHCRVMKEHFVDLTALQATESWYWNHQRHRYYHGGIDRPTSRSETAEPSVAKSAAPSSAYAADSGGGSESGPTNYTKTNNQEQGVDEADIVKTDGKYIYTLTGGEIAIVKSWPADEAKVVSRLKIGDGATPSNLFLNGDKLVAISYLNHGFQIDRGKTARPWYGATRVSVIDVRNRANPYVVRHVDVEGYTNQARMIGSDVYFVTNSYMHAPQKLAELTQGFDKWPAFDGSKGVEVLKREAYERIRTHLQSKLDQIDLTLSLPHKRVSGYRGKFSSRKFEPLTACNNIHVPRTGVQYGMVSLVHFDLRTPWKVNASSVFGQGWQVYGSENAIYVAMPNYSWATWYRWYNDQEPDYDSFNSTNIHKFELRRDVGRPTYAASGRVRGYLHNQFSMSEHKGDLRVATTDQNWWWGARGSEQREQANHIYVLRPDGNSLATIGRVEGLAPGERIYAARMFGDKGYIVTFRQVDPLFTLDLSDPTRPEVAGELKINGFSSYIHPIGNDQLLAVGQDADENGRVKGVHLQIFDVSDPSTPTRTHHHTFETMGYSWSVAQWDHKAFTYDPRTGTLALPMQFYPRGGSGAYFNGIFIFDVDAKKGFTDRGSISHVSMVESWRKRYCEKQPDAYICRYNQNYNYGSWAMLRRSIIMEDTIFTLSNYGLMAHKLERPDKPLSVVELAQM